MPWKALVNDSNWTPLEHSGGGLLFLTNISLIFVGFANWNITNDSRLDAQINVDNGELIDINNYFTFEGTPSIFEYTDEGIASDHVIDGGAENQEGYIVVPFQIDVASGKISDHIGLGTTSLKIETILINKNEISDFFNLCSVAESKLAIGTSGVFSDSEYKNVSLSNSPSNNELSSLFQLDFSSYKELKKVYFSVMYSVSFTTANFKSAFSSSNGMFEFSFRAGGVFNE